MGRSNDAGEKRPRVSGLETAADPRRPSSRPVPPLESPPVGENSRASSSSTTLRSVVERLRPTEAATAIDDNADPPQLRKTPFGVVRVASGAQSEAERAQRSLASEKTLTNDRPSHNRLVKTKQPSAWPCDARGLPSVRQRIHGGRIELKKDGTSVVYQDDCKAALVIASDGQRATLYSCVKSGRDARASEHIPIDQLPLIGQTLYNTAAGWLSRYLCSVSVASFCTHIPSAVCHVRANAPSADYEVHLPAGGERHQTERSGDIGVHVSRKRQALTLSSFIGGDGCASRSKAWSWRLVRLPIEMQRQGWKVVADDVLLQLSSREMQAVQLALSLSRTVDAISTAVSATRDRF